MFYEKKKTLGQKMMERRYQNHQTMRILVAH